MHGLRGWSPRASVSLEQSSSTPAFAPRCARRTDGRTNERTNERTARRRRRRWRRRASAPRRVARARVSRGQPRAATAPTATADAIKPTATTDRDERRRRPTETTDGDDGQRRLTATVDRQRDRADGDEPLTAANLDGGANVRDGGRGRGEVVDPLRDRADAEPDAELVAERAAVALAPPGSGRTRDTSIRRLPLLFVTFCDAIYPDDDEMIALLLLLPEGTSPRQIIVPPHGGSSRCLFESRPRRPSSRGSGERGTSSRSATAVSSRRSCPTRLPLEQPVAAV